MKLLISFILSIVSYIFVISFFLLIFNKKQKETVFIHTAIIVPNNVKSIINNKTKVLKKTNINKQIQKINIKPKKIKKGSSSAFTKGGDVSFNDIFKSVHYNVNTKKIHQKKQLNLSRFKGIEANLKKVKLINSNISYTKTGGNITDKEIENLIAKKLSPIWNMVSNIAGEYAKINIIFDGNTKAYIIDSNLPQYKQDLLIKKIKELRFDKRFNITVKFITKANK